MAEEYNPNRAWGRRTKNLIPIGIRAQIVEALDYIHGKLLCSIGSERTQQVVDAERPAILFKRGLFTLERSCFGCIAAGGVEGRGN